MFSSDFSSICGRPTQRRHKIKTIAVAHISLLTFSHFRYTQFIVPWYFPHNSNCAICLLGWHRVDVGNRYTTCKSAYKSFFYSFFIFAVCSIQFHRQFIASNTRVLLMTRRYLIQFHHFPSSIRSWSLARAYTAPHWTIQMFAGFFGFSLAARICVCVWCSNEQLIFGIGLQQT